MSAREQYSPGPTAAHVEKDGEYWTLVLERELRHSPEKVWHALTDPAQIHEWAPYDADCNLGAVGNKVKLTTYGAPSEHITETTVKLADAPRLLEFDWAGGTVRWKLEPTGQGTKLTLWASIDRRFIAMGAAGWHICLDVLNHLVGGYPLGRMAGPELMGFEGWQRLNAAYSQEFGVELPKW